MGLKGVNWPRLVSSVGESRELNEFKSLDWAVSKALDEQDFLVLNKKAIKGQAYIEYEDCKFLIGEGDLKSIFTVYKEYDFTLVRREDVVLDLGANIGAFSIPISKLCKQVYSVEPLFEKVLSGNIGKNRRKNIVVYKAAIGRSKGKANIQFMNKWGSINKLTLNTLLKDIKESINVLKIDIEGDEKYISPLRFKGIRVIMGEVHTYLGMDKWTEWNKWFMENNYEITKSGSRPDIEFRFKAWKN